MDASMRDTGELLPSELQRQRESSFRRDLTKNANTYCGVLC